MTETTQPTQDQNEPPHDFTDVEVELIGVDSNIFAIVGTVRRALRRAGKSQAQITDVSDWWMDAGSYDGTLQRIMRTVDVVG